MEKGAKMQTQQSQPYAIYQGFQEDGFGGGFHIFNIIGGTYHKSTVTIAKLQKLGIAIPEIKEDEKS